MNTLKPLKERRFRFGKKPIHIRSTIPIPKRFRRIVNNNRPFPLYPFKPGKGGYPYEPKGPAIGPSRQGETAADFRALYSLPLV